MLSRVRFVTIYVLSLTIFFEIGRIVFLVYHWRRAIDLRIADIVGSLVHGLPMDVASACALSLIPTCIVARSGFLPSALTRRLVGTYTVLMYSAMSLVVVADLEMFRIWGFHIDAYVLRYLASPIEAFASASSSPLSLLAGIFCALFLAAVAVFFTVIAPALTRHGIIGQPASLRFLIIVVPTLFLGANGGFRWRVRMTASSVYFSQNSFANKAAVNPLWNLWTTTVHLSDEIQVEKFTSNHEARRLVDSLLTRGPYAKTSGSDMQVVTTQPKRIVLIIWEGLTAKIIEPLGGLPQITPGFTQLATEGILFDSLYASGSRTNNGLVALLSGLPAHPVTAPLASSPRSAALPNLGRVFGNAGYKTMFYYGGPLEFENRARYLLTGGYDEILEKNDIDPVYWTSPWGAQDPYTLDRLFQAIDSVRRPLFAVALTLSSHEPFRVPPPTRVRGNSVEQLFLNAQAFTDEAMFRFIGRMKATAIWDSTLVIIVADHGSPYPFQKHQSAASPEQYRIPMLWLGGVLTKKNIIVHHILSQFDIPNTLLGQVGFSASQFSWGKNIFADAATSFAYYSFSNGFGYVDRTGNYLFDNESRLVIQQTGAASAAAVSAGRAFQQRVTQSYLDLTVPTTRRPIATASSPQME